MTMIAHRIVFLVAIEFDYSKKSPVDVAQDKTKPKRLHHMVNILTEINLISRSSESL
jgi:hypothetical protein